MPNKKSCLKISDLTREILHLSVHPFVCQYNLIRVKCIYMPGFCPSGLFFQWAFVLVDLRPCGLLSYTHVHICTFVYTVVYSIAINLENMGPCPAKWNIIPS